MLRDVGMLPIMPQGSYFMMADFSKLGRVIDNLLVRECTGRLLIGILTIFSIYSVTICDIVLHNCVFSFF